MCQNKHCSQERLGPRKKFYVDEQIYRVVESRHRKLMTRYGQTGKDIKRLEAHGIWLFDHEIRFKLS